MEVDNVEPPCFAETENIKPGDNACWHNLPDAWGSRIIEIRSQLIVLNELVDAGSILRLHDADIDDIELLVFYERELKKVKEEGK